jgi:hypothetical protein
LGFLWLFKLEDAQTGQMDVILHHAPILSLTKLDELVTSPAVIARLSLEEHRRALPVIMPWQFDVGEDCDVLS